MKDPPPPIAVAIRPDSLQGSPGTIFKASPAIKKSPDSLKCQCLITPKSKYPAQVEPNLSAPFLCMRLMSSQNQDEVESLQKELLKAGIASETRCHPMAETLGVNGVELWVQNERDFFDASKLYARMQERGAGKPKVAAGHSKGEAAERYMGAAKGEPGLYRPTNWDVNSLDARQPSEPRREELKHASSLLEKGLEQMFLRESELAGQCASLRSKMEELTGALAQAQGELARERDSRLVTESNQTEQISGLVKTLERERQDWQQQLKRRDESLKTAQEKLESMTRLLQAQQAAAVGLREEIMSLELRRDESEAAFSNIQAEALAEREARIAAEAQAQKAILDQQNLERQLAGQKELVQQIHAQLAGLGSLFLRIETNGQPGGN